MYTQSSLTSTVYQRTIHCRNKLCTPTTRDHNIHYVSYPTALAHRVQHCPSCHSIHIQSRDFSYVDWMCTQFQPLNHAIAAALVEELNNQNSRKSPHAQIQIEDILTQLPNPPKPLAQTSNGICPLHVSCTMCHATFDVIRTKPTAHTPPMFCIWCGTSHVTVQQYNTDETANYVNNTTSSNTLQDLATQFDVSLAIMTALYEQWTQDSAETYFSGYLATDDVKMVLSLAKGRNNPVKV